MPKTDALVSAEPVDLAENCGIVLRNLRKLRGECGECRVDVHLALVLLCAILGSNQ